MIDELVRPKYKNITFYCHNFSGYDVVFILKVLSKYNDSNKDKYVLSTILRDEKIIKLKITKDKHSVNIVDSYCILSDSLSNLGKSFGVDTLKSHFSYTFAKENTLFYIGPTPSISYYNDISQRDYDTINQPI